MSKVLLSIAVREKGRTMNEAFRCIALKTIFCAVAASASSAVLAFNSGSTGADGAFNPTASTMLPMPANGIFNFTTVNIPVGVTVTFQRNATNTPVVMLATGDVIIAGTIDVSGTVSATNTWFGNDGQPGLGGPGGYDGGQGGLAFGTRRGGNGLGPGGGLAGGINSVNGNNGNGGGGAGHAAAGTAGVGNNLNNGGGAGGAAYGSIFVQPLVGGSGGGGGGGTAFVRGTGGGGGGGAILLASSGAIELRSTAQVLANGGNSGSATVAVQGTSPGGGGAGSGGVIRLVANVMRGNGLLRAAGGSPGGGQQFSGGVGAPGRIRIEADQMVYANGFSSPAPSVDIPNALFITGNPSLRITSVAGMAAPAAPTGNMDITLPANTANPITVAFETSGVPVGSTINLVVNPSLAAAITAQSGPTTGTTTSATASTSVTIPTGHNVFQATVTYTIVVGLGEALSRYAQNERVEKIRLSTTLGGQSKMTLITISGKEYEAPAEVLNFVALGG